MTPSAAVVTVWRIRLDVGAHRTSQLRAMLSPDEQARAARYLFERDRRRFIAARGAVRCVLSGYLGVHPAAVVFGHGAHGKPMLAATDRPLSFNVSHSGELALLAVTDGRDVGIDLELIRRVEDLDALAGTVFGPRELAELHALAPAARQAAFFAGWTRKEAFLKARGDGLSAPLHDVVVSLDPGGAGDLLEVRGQPEESSRWTLRSLGLADGYAAAIAALGSGCQVVCSDWDERVPGGSPR